MQTHAKIFILGHSSMTFSSGASFCAHLSTPSDFIFLLNLNQNWILLPIQWNITSPLSTALMFCQSFSIWQTRALKIQTCLQTPRSVMDLLPATTKNNQKESFQTWDLIKLFQRQLKLQISGPKSLRFFCLLVQARIIHVFT